MVCKPLDKHKPKPKHRKGLWSPEEDEKLRNYILLHGHGCWSSIPSKAGLQRNGKSCRLRWINYLRPGLKRGMFSLQEEQIILTVHNLLGNKWSQIAQHLPGRTDNEIKNYWHSYLKKKMIKPATMEVVPKTENSNSISRGLVSTTNYADRSVPQRNDFQKEANRSCSSLPRLIFADWLSLDQVNGIGRSCIIPNSTDPAVAKDVFDQNRSFQGADGNEVYNGASDSGSGGDDDMIFSSPLFKLEGEILGGGFPDFHYLDEICSSFNMNNDVMYM